MSGVTLFLCGDVMTGRGIDQVLPHPSDPTLYEPWIRDARDYVRLAERRHGPVDRPMDPPALWGEALEVLDRIGPHLRIANLETSITTSDTPWPDKSIHYRMHPDNLGALTAARLDCCVLSNNHVLDWGRRGLVQTLAVLQAAGIRTAGAGLDLEEARAPVVLPVPGGRVLVLGVGHPSSGIPAEWAAGPGRPGVNLLPDLSLAEVRRIAEQLRQVRQPRDLVVVSVHWGGNWGYAVPEAHRRFARALVEEAGVDVVHGHSSHHPLGVEVHQGRPILYGCGDLVNDYEGISGYESYRAELGLMAFPTLDPATGHLAELRLALTRMEGMRLHRASTEEARWLAGVLERESAALGTRLRTGGDGFVVWDATQPAGV